MACVLSLCAHAALTLGLITLIVSICIRPPHLRLWPWDKAYRMPPGPRGVPLFGSLFSWLHARNGGALLIPWLHEQANWGEMTTLHMGTKTWVLLNTERVLDEIIVKRASVTHERPYFPIAGGIVSRNLRVFLHKTQQWRESRRLIHQLMTGPRSKEHPQIIEAQSVQLLRAYLDEPSQWYLHNYRYSTSIMQRIVAACDLQSTTAELNEMQKTVSTFLTSINSSLVEFFPQLASLPRSLQLWRKHWDRIGDSNYRIFTNCWDNMSGVRDDQSPPSFVRDLTHGAYAGTEEQAKYLTMLIISAGADNPRMAINAFMMSCLSAPEAMHKARAEADAVCGGSAERLPTLNDLPAMPYICAFVKEVLRWRPLVPLMPQRVLVEDLSFEGYTFPAGTEFLVNSIAVCKAGYERPAAFFPERWLETKNGRRASVEQDLWTYAFSGGRRVCVGYKLAQKELFLAFARILYCFDIEPNGAFNDTQLNAFRPGEPFAVKVVARTASHEHLIRSASTQ